MKKTMNNPLISAIICSFFISFAFQLIAPAQTPTPDAAFEKELAAVQLVFSEAATLAQSDEPESLRAAIRKFKIALARYQGLKAKVQEAYTLRQIAILHARLGENATALKLYDQVLGMLRELPNEKYGEAATLLKIGEVHYGSGDNEKALGFYLQALTIFRDFDSKGFDVKRPLADTSANIGLAYGYLNKYAEALAYHLAALPIYEKLEAKDGLASNLKDIGDTYFELDQKQKALEYFERSLRLYESLGDEENQSVNLVFIAEIYFITGLPEKSVGYLEKALAILQKIGKKEEAAAVRQKLASLYSSIGQKDKAAALLTKSGRAEPAASTSIEQQMQKVVPLLMEVAGGGDREQITATVQNELRTLNKDLGRAKGEIAATHAARMLIAGFYYGLLDDAKRSQEYFDRGMAIARAERSKELEVILLSFNGMIKGAKDPLIFIDYYKRALAIPSSLRTMRSMMILMLAGAYVSVYEDDPKAEYLGEASGYLHQGLALFREAGDKNYEASALAMLGAIADDLKQPQLAIFYLKQAVNVLQSVRGELKNLDQSLQDSYLQRVADVYHGLAEILIVQGRFFEAQQVMAMLKQDEYFDYIRRDADEIKKLAATLPPSSPERAALEKYDTLAGKVAESGAKYAKLLEIEQQQGSAFKRQAELKILKTAVETANEAFLTYLEKGLALELSQKTVKEIKEDGSLQGKLEQWGNGTVALYTVAGAESYRVILTTPRTQTDGKYSIPIADLNTKIFKFREALQNPAVDPRPLGKELYDILIKPVEKDLIAVDAKTLLWSLDGTLRYIPFGALSPDGVHYLAEKYQNVVVTSTTRQSLSAEVNRNWLVLGAGVTKESAVTEPQKLSFSPLPGVGDELLKIVRSETAGTQETGVLAGRRLVDQDFDLAAFEAGMKLRTADKKPKYNVIHLATHFHLGNDTANSFLLMGSNTALTLKKVSVNTDLNFNDVELVTLSACNTGFGTAIENKAASKEEERKLLEANRGAEVDSLATFIELRGAKAVMASLWAVADESTSMLMSEFYRLRKEDPAMTKAAAIQAAQLAMINGKLVSRSPNSGCRAELVAGGKKCDPSAPFAHPYYWAPFVLIGNWR